MFGGQEQQGGAQSVTGALDSGVVGIHGASIQHLSLKQQVLIKRQVSLIMLA